MFKNNNFIERSILGALSFLKDSIFADEYALKSGFLQSLDPRVKSITFLFLIIQVLLAKSLFILAVLYVFCLLIVRLSNIRLGFFLKRTWIFMPLFSLFIAIPALFSFFTPGQALVTLHTGLLKIIITRQGLFVATLFISRVITSVSFIILLSLTTRHFELLRVLRIFKVPQIFVMTLGMCYRYIFLFVQVIENTYLGIKSRIGRGIHYKKGRDIVSWNIALLWQRSLKLNEEVYNAMLSRGYNGEPVLINKFKTTYKDWVWVCFFSGISFWALYTIYGRSHF